MGLCLAKEPQVTRKLLTSGTRENFLCTNPFPPCTRKLVQALNFIVSAITRSFVSELWKQLLEPKT